LIAAASEKTDDTDLFRRPGNYRLKPGFLV
jgi:hypothetical protein